jgi:hypothetical protein
MGEIKRDFKCPDMGQLHRYFVAETVGVETEGKVFVLVVCTACGDGQAKEFKLTTKAVPLRLLLEEKQTKE